MNTSAEKIANGTGERLKRRYWRRDESAAPWYPWGIVQLIWLFFLLIVGALIIAPGIEADIETSVAKRLDSVDIAVADLHADGQIVSIAADAGSTNKTALQTIAGSTTCSTWAGNFPCPTTVNISMLEPAAEPAMVTPRSHRFMVERVENSVTLSGEVPSVAEESRILALADQHFSAVTNQLTISNEIASEGYEHGSNLAIEIASRLTQGHSDWDGESLSVLGFANADEIVLARQQFEQIGDDTLRGEFNVHELEMEPSNSQCNDGFAEQLRNSDIRFSTGSAEIDASSNELLASLADLAVSCSGNLIIEGHTDSRGDATMNKSLSQARADAVLAALISRGVNADRLKATGYGEEQPIATNETPTGRAANRRITITVPENN